MFVTAWLGILEISTGKIIAANAGHEYPIIRHGNGEFEVLKDKHGFVLGGLEGMKYTDYEITLEKGSAIFLYTDGATEATNEHNELFGEKRLLRALNDSHAEDPVELLGSVKNAISEFVGEADQFDDLTMLGIIYGSGNKKKQK
jgi:sigma-B regulation protein RsbU (phosphoserine phosphatase)